jgi:ABC-type sugar transport system ATPase subunit
MSSVTYEAVSKRFDSVEALKALDLVVRDGAFCVLLGPSGSWRASRSPPAAGS